MIGIWAISAYLTVILLWVLILRRNIGEAMLVGFVVAVAFNGKNAIANGWDALADAFTDEIVYATVLFVFMGYFLEKTGVMERVINLLDSLVGRFKGGPIYVNTLASAGLGSIVHNQAAIAATVGSITVPWMKKAGVSSSTSAALNTGNASLGITFPFSASMFVLVGSTTAGNLVEVDDLIIPLFAGGLWCVLHRVIVAWIFVRRSGIEATSKELRPLLRRAWLEGWTTLFLFVGVVGPMLLTTGPVSDLMSGYLGDDTSDFISLIFWIPVLLLLIGGAIGYARLPRQASAWRELIENSVPRFGIVGITVLFAFAGANALASTGLPDQLGALLNDVDMPVWLLALVIGVIALLVAAPLSATATMAAVGSIGVAALISAGVPPATAAVAVLVFASGEATVPPGGAPLFVSCAIAREDPLKVFPQLLLFYGVPLLLIGTLIAVGFIPLPVGG